MYKTFLSQAVFDTPNLDHTLEDLVFGYLPNPTPLRVQLRLATTRCNHGVHDGAHNAANPSLLSANAGRVVLLKNIFCLVAPKIPKTCLRDTLEKQRWEIGTY